MTEVWPRAERGGTVLPPWLTPRFFRAYGGRPSELEDKFLLLVLFALGGLATWADSEAVLPAYLLPKAAEPAASGLAAAQGAES
jgi:hypothetical protein